MVRSREIRRAPFQKAIHAVEVNRIGPEVVAAEQLVDPLARLVITADQAWVFGVCDLWFLLVY